MHTLQKYIIYTHHVIFCAYTMYIHMIQIYNSYLTVFGVHEMHGRMHPNYCQITILLVVDLCSSLAYFMMTQPLPIAGKLPIKTLVARQLPTNVYNVMLGNYQHNVYNVMQ